MRGNAAVVTATHAQGPRQDTAPPTLPGLTRAVGNQKTAHILGIVVRRFGLAVRR